MRKQEWNSETESEPEPSTSALRERPSPMALAFTRYCHKQYYMAYIAIQGDRGGVIHCATVLGVRGGEGGAQTKGVFAS